MQVVAQKHIANEDMGFRINMFLKAARVCAAEACLVLRRLCLDVFDCLKGVLLVRDGVNWNVSV